MNDFKLIKYKFLYYSSFCLIEPFIVHFVRIKNLKKNFKLLSDLKKEMLYISRKQQNDIKSFYLQNIDYFSSKIDHILFKEFITYKVDLNDMYDFLTLTDRLVKRVKYHYSATKKVKDTIVSSFDSYSVQMSIYRQTYLAIYNKIGKKFRTYPAKYLLKLYKFDGKKIW